MKCTKCKSNITDEMIAIKTDEFWVCPHCHQENYEGMVVKVEFTKHDNGKLRYGLIPPLAEAEMVGVLTFGAQKYSVDNWRKCDDMSRYVDAALRHISAYRLGEFKDSETGMHHLAHAMCCLSFIVDIELGNIEIKVVEP